MNDQQADRLATTGLSRADAVVFQVIAGANLAFATLVLVLGGIAAVTTITSDTVDVPLRFAHPVSVEAGDVAVATAESGRATVTAEGISAGARALLAAGDILGASVGAVIAVAIAMLLWRLAQGRPFHRSLFGAALLAGSTMTLGGLLAIAAHAFGAMQVAVEVDPAGDVFTPGFEFDPTILAAGAAVLLLAFVFQAGNRLQRETEGLV
ncbi:MAG TPA: hypothetical protein VNR36_12885 [Pseudolysinimonas sp.]|nr:hypothetical protein [Pseudolysinimonas sp.]